MAVKGGISDQKVAFSHYIPNPRTSRTSSLAACEASREKMLQLGELHEILLKFHILKVEFLHEKIIFFDLDFFLTRYGCVAFKNELYIEHLPKCSDRLGHLSVFE